MSHNQPQKSIAIIAKIQSEIVSLELIEIFPFEDKSAPLKRELYTTQYYPSFIECLQVFLSDIAEEVSWPQIAVIAVPGVPFENCSTVLNSPWP